MNKTIFRISKMDCPSEEQLIRMKLQPLATVKLLEFDLAARRLTVCHEGGPEPVLSVLQALDLGTHLLSTEAASGISQRAAHTDQRSVLWAVLGINFLFFGIELLAGVSSGSMGLVGDSLDMLADSIVYALALFAVGGSAILQGRVARIAGYFQIVLAVAGFAEVVRRFLGAEKMPDFRTMILVSGMALLANILCLYLLQRSRSREAHMRASLIFTSNDILINSGVIVAGLLVHWLNSGYPDLIIGAVVFVLVIRGAYRILNLAK